MIPSIKIIIYQGPSKRQGAHVIVILRLIKEIEKIREEGLGRPRAQTESTLYLAWTASLTPLLPTASRLPRLANGLGGLGGGGEDVSVVHGDHHGAVCETHHLDGLEGDEALPDLELLTEALQYLPPWRRRRGVRTQ